MQGKLLISHGGETMPDRQIPDSKKDQAYDLAMARYSLSLADPTAINNQWAKYIRNRSYYAGKQWFESEDIDFFLKDDHGNERKRIQVVMNMIRPLVEQFRGTASAMKFNFAAEPLSSHSKTRREEVINMMVNLSRVAQARGGTKTSSATAIMNRFGVSDDPEETRQFAEENYSDALADGVTELVKMLFNKDNLVNCAPRLAYEMALGGLIGIAPRISGGHVSYNVISPRDLIWDTTVDDGDTFFRGANYQAVCPFLEPSQIAEAWGLKSGDERIQILDAIKRARITDGAMRSSGPIGELNKSSNPRVYSVYFKDYVYREHAYFKDPYTGAPILREIGTQSPTGDVFSLDKAIDPPDNDVVRRVFGSEKVATVVIENIRYCDFVPREWAQDVAIGGDRLGKKIDDVVLSSGVYELTEANQYDTAMAELPIKMAAWALEDGNVLSPVDDAIDPQRMTNRILSAQESIINESGGRMLVYDKDALVGTDGEAAFNLAMKDGRPFGVNAGGAGIANTIAVHDLTPGQGTMNMFALVQQIQQMVRSSTGVHEPLVGQPSGGDQYVGTTQMLMERAATVQRPVYDAITGLVGMVAQHMGTAARIFYLDNPTNLYDMVSFDKIEPMLASRYSRLEQHRIITERIESEQMLKNEGDEWIKLLIQAQLADMESIGHLLGRSTVEDVRKYLLQKARQMQRAQAAQAEAMAAQQEAAALGQQQMQLNEQGAELDKMEIEAAQKRDDHQNKLDLARANKVGELEKAKIAK